MDRRFARSDPVGRVRDLVDVHLHDAGAPALSYVLATHYPLHELTGAALEGSIDDAQLAGKVLYVHDLDA